MYQHNTGRQNILHTSTAALLHLLSVCYVFRAAIGAQPNTEVMSVSSIGPQSLSNPRALYRIETIATHASHVEQRLKLVERFLPKWEEWQRSNAETRRDTVRALLQENYAERRSPTDSLSEPAASHLARYEPHIVLFLIDLLSRPDVFRTVIQWEEKDQERTACFRVHDWEVLRNIHGAYPLGSELCNWVRELRVDIESETIGNQKKLDKDSDNQDRFCVVSGHEQLIWYINFRNEYRLQFDSDEGVHFHKYHLAAHGRLVFKNIPTIINNNVQHFEKAGYSDANHRLFQLVQLRTPLSNWREWQMSQTSEKAFTLRALFHHAYKIGDAHVPVNRAMLTEGVAIRHLIRERPHFGLFVIDLQSREDLFGTIVAPTEPATLCSNILDWDKLQALWKMYPSNLERQKELRASTGRWDKRLVNNSDYWLAKRPPQFCVDASDSYRSYFYFRTEYPLQFDCDDDSLTHHVFHLASAGRLVVKDL